MNKRLKISFMSLLAAMAMATLAQAAEPQATPASDAAATTQAEAKKAPLSDAYCLRHTGTRITHRAASEATDKTKTDPNATTARKSATCSNGAIGRAYTRDDLDRTGEINIADALRKLDPAIH